MNFLITDYSTRADDAASCGVPSIYFQFDREAVIGAEGSTLAADFPQDPAAARRVVRDSSQALEELNRAMQEVGSTSDRSAIEVGPGASDRLLDAISEMLRLKPQQ